jgi:hypothetical protein
MVEKAEIFGDDPKEWEQLLDPDKDGKDGIAPKKIDHYTKAVCEVYLRKLNLYTKEEFDTWRRELDVKFKEAESSFWQKLWGQIWYRIVLPKAHELNSPKQIFKVLSKIDKLIPYLPEGYWIAVLKGIDWVADLVYENME